MAIVKPFPSHRRVCGAQPGRDRCGDVIGSMPLFEASPPAPVTPFPAAARALSLNEATLRVHDNRGAGTGERCIAAECKAFVAALRRQGVSSKVAAAEGIAWERALRAALAEFHRCWADSLLTNGPRVQNSGRPGDAA